MLDITKKEQIQGIRLREKELNAKWQHLFINKGSKDKETERYDAFYTCYGLIADCLEAPHKKKLHEVGKYIASVKKYLKNSDIEELREIYKILQQDLDILMGDILGAKRIA